MSDQGISPEVSPAETITATTTSAPVQEIKVIQGVTGSPKFHMSESDWHKWGFQTLVFSAPILIVFFGAIQNGIPFKEAIYLMYIALIQAVYNWLTKFVSNTQKGTV